MTRKGLLFLVLVCTMTTAVIAILMVRSILYPYSGMSAQQLMELSQTASPLSLVESLHDKSLDNHTLIALAEMLLSQKKADCIKVLLLNGLDPNSLLGNGQSLLLFSIIKEDTISAKILIEYGANVNIKDNNGWTPLHQSVQANLPTSFIVYLVSKGADPNIKDCDSLTPLSLARNPGMIAALKNGG